ncbi:L-cystine transport system substrate-binding protein [Clostridium cavendishii DSM 21758]|uniref:L-cystine transport system substrate-binding protein n=1 Tax=Clostridium cavendishii DSM 21758 TaxID=1121302 RepID=A0A1M6FBC9_9CLOT|nr:transporter substrate-binding domain-containing protein [Clostridium cavendishii]SHI94956.1 L-cystine transport system substrate-binding protein [Clostridium cavendishii DSM 21758]
MKLKVLLASILTMAVLLGGCASNSNSSAKSSDKKDVVKVGTEGAYAPFTFKNSKGELDGYDVEAVREIAKRAKIDVEFVTAPWDSMFLGLESKKFDMVANQIAKNKEREEKYIFSDYYLVSAAQVIVVEDRNDINSIEDLKGKKVGSGTGSNYTKKLIDFNNQNKDKKIDIKYYEGNFGIILDDVVSKRIDATFNDRLSVAYNVKQNGVKVKLVGEPIDIEPSYFVFRPESKELQKKVDEALKSMKADGTLAELSKKWFDADYTKK